MTHHDGYRAAAVARRTDARSLGIDAEPHLPLPEGVLELVALPAELRRTAELSARHPLVRWDRLLFSTKEAVYKAWFPLTHRWLGHEEADIAVDPAGGFTARLLASHPGVPPRGSRGAGRWTGVRPHLRPGAAGRAAAGRRAGAGGCASGETRMRSSRTRCVR